METDKNEQNPINSMSDEDKYEKYAKPQKGYWKTLGGLVAKLGIINFTISMIGFFCVTSLGWWSSRNPNVIDLPDDTPRVFMNPMPYSTHLRYAYWPFFKQDSHIVFAPRYEWWWMFFFVSLMTLWPISCAPFAVFFKNIRDRKQARHSVATMIDIEKMAMEHKFDDETKKKLISVIPYILKNMSADNRVYFDMIMDGSVSVNDKKFGETSVQGNILQRFRTFINDKKFLKAVVMIMAGHLQSHPEDLQRVKEIFDNEKSMPSDLANVVKKLTAKA